MPGRPQAESVGGAGAEMIRARNRNTPGAGKELRFLCDEMLRGLGRWLRAAGYDTLIAAGGLPDRALAARCAEEDRVLLTKDRRLAATVEGTAPVVMVPGDGVDEAARALRSALGLDWQYAPFTRCLVDNRPLEAAPSHLAAVVPERSRTAGGPLRLCPECGRLYWPGGHVRRMQQASCLATGGRPTQLRETVQPRPVRAAAGGQRHERAGWNGPAPLPPRSRRE